MKLNTECTHACCGSLWEQQLSSHGIILSGLCMIRCVVCMSNTCSSYPQGLNSHALLALSKYICCPPLPTISVSQPAWMDSWLQNEYNQTLLHAQCLRFYPILPKPIHTACFIVSVFRLYDYKFPISPQSSLSHTDRRRLIHQPHAKKSVACLLKPKPGSWLHELHLTASKFSCISSSTVRDMSLFLLSLFCSFCLILVYGLFTMMVTQSDLILAYVILIMKDTQSE